MISAAFTPMDKTGSMINLDKVGPYYQNLRVNGITGTMICGTTGEGYSLSVDERIELASEWSTVVDDDFKLMVHVGHNSIQEIRKLVESSVSFNSSAIVLSPPIFFKPNDIQNLLDFLEECIGGTTSVDFYYYHIPSMTGVEFPMLDFLKQVLDRNIDIKGIKFTHEDIGEYADCVKLSNHHFDMIFGRDELLFDSLTAGAKSALGSTYNYMSPLFHELIDLYQMGKLSEARLLAEEIDRIIGIIVEFGGGVIAGKAVMSLIGLDMGQVRQPLNKPNNTQLKDLEKRLKATKFFDYRNKQLITH